MICTYVERGILAGDFNYSLVGNKYKLPLSVGGNKYVNGDFFSILNLQSDFEFCFIFFSKQQVIT